MNLTRRSFLRDSRTALVGTALLPAAARLSLGANEQLSIGIIGCGSRARNDLMKEIFKFSSEENARITAVCDVWKQHREEAAEATKEQNGQEPKQYEDYRELLAQKEIDAVVIATPEHQHITMLIDAIKAGKDVYVEKPLAMNLDELRRGVDTVKASDRVVQVGTQLRSWPSFTGCRKMVQEGGIGKVIKVMQVRNTYRPYWHSYVRPIEEKDTNWDRFLFNREQRPFDADQHSAWYGYMDYTLGPIASYMAHYIDLVHYITGAYVPRSAVTMAGTYQWKDQRSVPDSVHTLLDYPEGFMVSYCTVFGNGSGSYTRFFGNKGMLDCTDWREPFVTGSGIDDPDRAPDKANVPDVDITPHMQNWLQCIRSRKQPNANIDAGYQHAVACLLGYEALVQKRQMAFDQEKREFVPA